MSKIIVSSDRRCTSFSTVIVSVLGLTGLSLEISEVFRTVLKPVPRELPAPGKDLPHANDEEGFASGNQVKRQGKKQPHPSALSGLQVTSQDLTEESVALA